MKKTGFTLFFAMLVASLALSVGLAIYDLTIREIDLSNAVSDSQYAIYTADLGVECALYWDNKCSDTTCPSGFGSAFATSSASAVPASGVTCKNIDIAAEPWTVTAAANSATTTFSIGIVSTNAPFDRCVLVTVAKVGTPAQTTITSNGFTNAGGLNCRIATGGLELERTLQVTY